MPLNIRKWATPLRGGGTQAAAQGAPVEVAMELLARFSVWIPCLVTCYAVARWAHLPLWIIALLMLALIAKASVAMVRWKRDTVHCGGKSSVADGILLVMLLSVLSAPVWPSFRDAVLGETPRYYFSDEAYLMMVARGMRSHFPPPDLSWAGATNLYNPGAPLVVEGISRATGIPMEAVFYGILPLIGRLVFVGGSWRIFQVLMPVWSLRRRLLSITVAAGLFFVDPIAIVWNLRNLIMTGQVDLATIFLGMPVAGTIPLSGFQSVLYAAPLADVFLLAALANIHHARALTIAAALGGVYLTKAQTGAPALLGFVAAAAVVLCLLSSKSPLKIVIACLPVLAFMYGLGSAANDLTVAIGSGANLRILAREGEPYLSFFGQNSGIVSALLGVILLASRWLVPLLAVAALLWFTMRHSDRDKKCTTTVGLLVIAACVGFSTFVEIRPGPATMKAFQATHEGVKNLLWLPYEGYLERMYTEISASESNSAAVLLVGIMAAGGLVEFHRRVRGNVLRLAATSMLVISLTIAVGMSVFNATIGHATNINRSKLVNIEASEALRRIPVNGAVIMTNDLAYDEKSAPHLPMMNAWAPALYGHQLWASNFMYSLQYQDLIERYDSFNKFWSVPYGPWHDRFLDEHNIEWLLEKKHEVLALEDRVGIFDLIYENDGYRVYRKCAVNAQTTESM